MLLVKVMVNERPYFLTRYPKLRRQNPDEFRIWEASRSHQERPSGRNSVEVWKYKNFCPLPLEFFLDKGE